MSAPQSLLQAALNRLAARLGSSLADTAATLSLLAQDAPARVQQELSLFWEEVELEAARLERGEESGGAAGAGVSASSRGVWSGFTARGQAGPAGERDPQAMIDALRAQVVRLSLRLEKGAAGSGTQGPGPA